MKRNQPQSAETKLEDDVRSVAARALRASWVAAVVVVALLIGVAMIGRYVSNSLHLAHVQAATTRAESISDALREFRSIYTSEVVERTRRHGIGASHDYQQTDDKIPLPATLTKMIGERLSSHGPGSGVRLFSEFPFPWQVDGGAQTEMERAALEQLMRDPTQPFIEHDDSAEQIVLYYATADVMGASCVACHNSHPDTPKNDWKIGDVRGVLGVSVPLSGEGLASGDATQHLAQTLMLMTLLGGGVVVILLVAVSRWSHLQAKLVAERDLTGRENKQLEQALREVANQKGALDEHAIVSITDVKGTLVYVNDKFVQISGYSRDELIGKTHRVVKSDEHSHEFFRDMWKTIASGRVWSGELKNTAKDGSHYWLAATIVPFRDKEGKIEQYVAIRMDITDRKRSEEELKTLVDDLDVARQDAEVASLAKSEFLANMSHEIRTPLNGVIGVLDLLQGSDLDAKQQKYAHVGIQSAGLLLSLINDILDFSKIEAGKLELDSADFEFVELLEEVGDILAYTAEQKKIELIISADARLPRVITGDPTRLRQMILNLANNAVKFTDQGEVVIRVDLEEQRDHQVVVRVSVIDTGVGIAPDRIDRLFKSFSQVDASTTRKHGGTGLGLAISNQLALLMGSQVSVESELGVGSTFSFTTVLDCPDKQPDDDNSLSSGLAGLRILVVDDNETNRDILHEQLALHGMLVETVESGEAALPLLHQANVDGNPFALAVLDMLMPGMSGVELAEKVREDKPQIDTGLLLLSSIGNDLGAERLREAGFRASMTKPIKIAQLLKSLRGALRDESPKTDQGKPSVLASSDVALPESLTVLLAEDNEINQMVASEILRRSGIDCHIVPDGQEALEAFKTGKFDVILMDCQMPVMDGFAATEAIRQWEHSGANNKATRSHIPIIALTANAIRGDRERCLDAGMDEYLSKPLDPELLIQTIREFGAKAVQGNDSEDGNVQNGGSMDSSEDKRAPIDFDALVQRCIDDKAFAIEILKKFSEQAPEMLAKITRAFAGSDSKELGDAAHSLKGAAANIGAESLREIAAIIEAAGRADDLASLDDVLDELKIRLDSVLMYANQLSTQASAA